MNSEEKGECNFSPSPLAGEGEEGESDHLTHLEDWQIHADNQAADQNAKNGHNHRLHQSSEVVHHIIHYTLVMLSNLLQHVIQVTGFLTNSCQLHSHHGKNILLAHGSL